VSTYLDVDVLHRGAGHVLGVLDEVVNAAAVAAAEELEVLDEVVVGTDQRRHGSRLNVGDVAGQHEREEALLGGGGADELHAHGVAVEGVRAELDVIVEGLEDGVGDVLGLEAAESAAVGSRKETLHRVAGDRTGDSHTDGG